MDPVPNRAMPNPTIGIIPQPRITPPAPGPDTSAIAPVHTKTERAPPPSPGFPQQPVAPTPSLAQVVPPGFNLDQGALMAQIGDWSIAQSLAVTQAGGSHSSQWQSSCRHLLQHYGRIEDCMWADDQRVPAGVPRCGSCSVENVEGCHGP